MASTGRSAFSQDGQYYAFCGNDGKLKIWETASGRLKHEYTPNRHLSSPCSIIGWIPVNSQSAAINVSPLPRKRRRRKSISEESDRKFVVAMGSTNGKITLYDVAAASVSAILENGHSSTITAICWSVYTGLITAANDYHIVEWNLQENGIKCKWKSGKTKVTAMAVLSNGKSLLSAERIIKWWNLTTKQLIRIFTGHANHVTFLHTVQVNDTTSYLISGACVDSHLSVWALDKSKNDKASIATLAMQDEATSISILVAEELQVVVLVTTQSGQAQLFKYQPNGHTKPLKPSLNIAVAADVNQKETVQQIPILAGHLTKDEKLLLAYGSYLNLTFEKVMPDFSDKVQCLIRSEKLDAKKSKERKEETISKVKPTAMENVKYLAPGLGVPTQKRNRTTSGSQLLLKDRLENLSLNADANTSGKIPTKGANMTQLLMQALNSKDKTILTTVLFTKNETVIRNTITKLPVQAITPLLKELTLMLQGKTYSSKIAAMWLETLIMTHAAHLMSRPDITETLSPILSFIDAKLPLLTAIQRLKGRVSLITGQISQANEEHNKDIIEESLLVYQDPDSSDEGADKDDVDLSSESDDNWEEMSNQDVQDEQDEEDNRSIKFEDDNDDMDDNDSIHS